MSDTTPARHPSGTNAGGRFALSPHDEADPSVALDESSTDTARMQERIDALSEQLFDAEDQAMRSRAFLREISTWLAAQSSETPGAADLVERIQSHIRRY